MKKTITIYLIKRFISPLIYGICLFLLIIIVSEMFDRIDTLTQYRNCIPDFIIYLLWRIPEWFVQILPVSVLLATLFSLGGLARDNEITALKAAGQNLSVLISPLIIFTFFISLVSLFINEAVIPVSNKKAEYTYSVRVKGKEPVSTDKIYNVIISGKHGFKYTIGLLDIREKSLHNVSVYKFDDNSRLSYRVDSDSALWQEEGKWLFSNGIIYRFKNNQIYEEEKFSKKILELAESPDELIPVKEKPKQMNFSNLKAHIKRLQQQGMPANREKVELHLKLAFPFSNLVIFLLGVPFALEMGRGGKSIGFALSIFISFLYWGTIMMGQAMGETRLLPPFIAAWMANIIFLLLGGILLFRVRK